MLDILYYICYNFLYIFVRKIKKRNFIELRKMETKEIRKTVLKKAFGMGFISIFAYLTSYYTRSLLSVATPNMLKTGEYTAEFVGLLSSVYFLVYAAGQLINGFAGDIISPKYMIFVGLLVTGAVTVAFPLVPFAWMQIGCFALMGLGLSMLRGPIMKMVSENLNKDYSRTICTCLSAASFAGPLVASGFAILFKWDFMFIISGIITIFVAAVSFVSLIVFEKKGMLVFHSSKRSILGGFLGLFKIEKFVFYMIVGGVVEIAGSAISFWIPTYLSDALGLDSVTTNVLYSVISIVMSIAPFLALFIFKVVRERDIAMMRCGFSLAVISFILMLFIPGVVAKVGFLILAKLCLACCASVLWGIYIPGMGSTGKVSSINGVINCTGYLSASVANSVFARLLGMSWNGVILVWCGIAAIGLVASFIVRSKKKNA